MFIDLGASLNGELSEFIINDNDLIVLPGKNMITVNLKTKAVKQFLKQVVFIGAMEKTAKGYLFT